MLESVWKRTTEDERNRSGARQDPRDGDDTYDSYGRRNSYSYPRKPVIYICLKRKGSDKLKATSYRDLSINQSNYLLFILVKKNCRAMCVCINCKVFEVPNLVMSI